MSGGWHVPGAGSSSQGFARDNGTCPSCGAYPADKALFKMLNGKPACIGCHEELADQFVDLLVSIGDNGSINNGANHALSTSPPVHRTFAQSHGVQQGWPEQHEGQADPEVRRSEIHPGRHARPRQEDRLIA